MDRPPYRSPMYVPHVPPRPTSANQYVDNHNRPPSSQDDPLSSNISLSTLGKRQSYAQMVNSQDNLDSDMPVSVNPHGGEKPKFAKSRSPNAPSEKTGSVAEIMMVGCPFPLSNVSDSV